MQMRLITGDDVGLLKVLDLQQIAKTPAEENPDATPPAQTPKRRHSDKGEDEEDDDENQDSKRCYGFSTSAIIGTVDAAAGIALIRSLPKDDQHVVVVRRDGSVEIFNPADGTGREVVHLGIDAMSKAAAGAPEKILDLRISDDGSLTACSNRGKLFLGTGSFAEDGVYNLSEVKEFQLAHESLHAFSQHPQCPRIFATGGKECSVSIYDLEKMPADEEKKTAQPVWRAKNAKADRYRDNPPIWVTDIAWLDVETSTERFAVTTAYSQIMVYDTAVARRPVKTYEIDDKPLRICRAVHGGQSIVFTDNVGNMGVFSLKTGKLAGNFKGFVGTITNVWAHPTQPLVAAVSLDRYLRIYDLDTRNLVQEVYLRQRQTSVCAVDSTLIAIKDGKLKRTDVPDEEDALWDSLGLVDEIERREDKKRQKLRR